MTATSIRAGAFGVALALGAVAPDFAQAPSTAPARSFTAIVIDVDRVISESSAGKSVQATIRPQADAFQARQKKLQGDFDAETQALRTQAQSKTIAQDVVEAKARDLQQREQTAGTDLANRKNAIQSTQNAMFNQILDAMNPIIVALMKERGAIIALPRSAVLQRADSVDVTPDVISRLDRSLPRATATAPAQTAPRR